MDPITLQKVIAFRKDIHKHPQASLQQFQTRDRIKAILRQFGIQQQQFSYVQPTALVVSITGKALQIGQKRIIAFRADIDALNMQQNNHQLQYKSINKGVAHMCGHDGHIACLIGFVPLFLQSLQKVPKNKQVRLFFQPSEQGQISGAQIMVKAGVLDQVDQVYGMHNWPTADVGQLWCKQGPVMSQITILKIIIVGTSGHGSQPQKLKDCVRGGVKFYQKAMEYVDYIRKYKNDVFVCTLPVFKAGQRYNVISDTCIIQGSIRSLEIGLAQKVVDKFKGFLKELQQQGFITKLKTQVCPMNINSKQESQHVLRVAKSVFGQGKVSQGKLPFRASQDFGYFTQIKPGAFFFLSSSRKGEGQNAPMLHNSCFDFNDDVIENASKFWYQLAMDRLKQNNQ